MTVTGKKTGYASAASSVLSNNTHYLGHLQLAAIHPRNAMEPIGSSHAISSLRVEYGSTPRYEHITGYACTGSTSHCL